MSRRHSDGVQVAVNKLSDLLKNTVFTLYLAILNES